MNLGLSPELKSAFSDVINMNKYIVTEQAQKIFDPNWLAGFATGEGCFYVVAQKRPTFKTGYSIKLRFFITQHFRYENLLISLIYYFDSGNLYKNR